MNNKICYRESRQRKRIKEILKSTRSHPTADWLYNRLKKDFPNLSLSTVYRNLRILKAQGRIQVIPYGHTFDRFDGNPHPHSHLACRQCGKIFDIEIYDLDHLQEAFTKDSNFIVERATLYCDGLCGKCKGSLSDQSKE